MKITVSFLKSKFDRETTLKRIDDTDAEFIHVDIMDGKFVENKTLSIEECLGSLKDVKKRLDIHLMVEKPEEYIEELSTLNVTYLTIHIELGEVVSKYIDRIHELGIRAGLAINPETDISLLKPYLDRIDYIIVMGVNPGKGGQSLIVDTIDKLKNLKSLREDNCYHYLLCLDGGVNKDTRTILDDADILVSGSYICMSDDYQIRIDEIR